MNKQLIFIFLIISILTISGCATNKTAGGKLTEDISDYEALCTGSMADTCFQGVAMYNQNSQICNNIVEEDLKSICKEKITQGTFSHRKMTQGAGCSFDGTPFGQSCEESCNEKELSFKKDERKSIDDPLPLTSVEGYMSCKENKLTAFMACYCY